MKIRVIKHGQETRTEAAEQAKKPVKTVAGVVKKWIADVQDKSESEKIPSFERVFGTRLRPSKLA